jgi:uncharacterized protein
VVTSQHRDERIEQLTDLIRKIYEDRAGDLPFHGWHHIDFVRSKATQFARERGANAILVEAAALVHDLNYVVAKNSGPDAGRELRRVCLEKAGFDDADVEHIEQFVCEAHTASRSAQISVAAAALSDADTLFKALPVTPVVLAHRYIAENGISLRTLADKILDEQEPLLRQEIYFYDPAVADRYLPWARANLGLWRSVRDALNDPDVTALLESAGVRA